MRSDSLPSPLNVPQELMCHLFWRNKERTKEVFARAVFWLISGPIAIATTAVLWAASLPLTLAWGYRVIRSNGAPMLVPALLGIGFNLGLAPMVTAWMWIEGVVGVWRQTNGSIEVRERGGPGQGRSLTTGCEYSPQRKGNEGRVAFFVL